jgi:hypothetical protein
MVLPASVTLPAVRVMEAPLVTEVGLTVKEPMSGSGEGVGVEAARAGARRLTMGVPRPVTRS